ncbi:hypothetical protein NL676_001999 [Syzygium grande]|nr:hypothetical protein NL676_001999 [Syzygium grande]
MNVKEDEGVLMPIDGQNHEIEEDDELVEVPWLSDNEEELQAARGKIRTFEGENAYRVAWLLEIPGEIDVEFKEAINKYAATGRVNIDFIKNDKDEEIVEQREANPLVVEMHHNSATTQKITHRQWRVLQDPKIQIVTEIDLNLTLFVSVSIPKHFEKFDVERKKNR